MAACDAALLFGDKTSPVSLGLIKDCRDQGKPWVHVEPGVTRLSHVTRFLAENRHVKTVLVAGNRESRSPGIGAKVGRFLSAALRQLGHERAGQSRPPLVRLPPLRWNKGRVEPHPREERCR